MWFWWVALYWTPLVGDRRQRMAWVIANHDYNHYYRLWVESNSTDDVARMLADQALADKRELGYRFERCGFTVENYTTSRWSRRQRRMIRSSRSRARIAA
jgi:hypothetical protein